MKINSIFLFTFCFTVGVNTMVNAKASENNEVSHIEKDASKDFDFEIGLWQIKHRKLRNVMDNSDEWIEFEGTSFVQKVLGGNGNIEDHVIHFPDGSVRALAIRSYNKQEKHWSIWWLDGRSPDSVGVPVVGHFENGVGLFYADEVIQGTPVKVRFEWTVSKERGPRWEQAFSKDGGVTWKTNWTMEFTRPD